MSESELLRRILRLAVRDIQVDSPAASAVLEWCKENAAFLGLPDDRKGKSRPRGKKVRKGGGQKSKAAPWKRLHAALAEASGGGDANPPAVIETAERLAIILELCPEDACLLRVAVAVNRLRRTSWLVYLLRRKEVDVMRLVAELAGLDSVDAVAQSALLRLGLIELRVNGTGERAIHLSDVLDRALRHGTLEDDSLIECLVGPRVSAELSCADFAERAEAVDLMHRILEGALKTRAAGVNILLYGRPGTGKTALAKALAEAAKAQLYAVGEVDEFGEEPSRWERVASLKLAQRLLARRSNALLLFDEMEDLIGDVQRALDGDYFSQRDGSKVFINRLLETNPVPTLWTSNAIENIDPAVLRRMSFVLKMGLPPAAARKRIVGRIAESEGLKLSESGVSRLTDIAPESVTVARTAFRTARLAGGDEAAVSKAVSEVADALVCGLRYGRRFLREKKERRPLDLGLYHGNLPIADLIGRLTRPDAPLDFSLLLMGLPGTGKTALAHHLAEALGRPLKVRRASDLLSKWIGETEQQIADAFAAAAEEGQVLLFDEIDSLLFDRKAASHSWEVSQVNELLTWMDGHPMPFLAATNHSGKLDPAAMRRFDFKLELKPLPPTKAAQAYRRFFGAPPPATLDAVSGLTPGDFAVVARQLRFAEGRPEGNLIVERLAKEVEARGGARRPTGFRTRRSRG